MTRRIKIEGVQIGGGARLALIAGPCVIESRAMALDIARKLAEWAKRRKIPFVFKASYDKANRSSHKSFRGLGIAKGMEILAEIRSRFGVPILTDVHSEQEVPIVAQVVDCLQVPAFLCRQTDLLIAAGESGRVVNVKKGQFLAPWDMKNVVAKIESTGNRRIVLTERGVSFGYGQLVADMRSLPQMQELGYPVVFDATHSVQRPGGGGDFTAGDGKYAPALARAAVATGVDGVFIETHVHPADALSDKENCLALSKLDALWNQLRAIDAIVR